MGLIRILLAIAVLCSHFGKQNRMLDPALAVEAFFVISGFYMAMVLNEKYLPTTEHGRSATYRLFWSSRILRLFPAYVIVLAASILVQGMIYPQVGHSVAAAFATWHGQTRLAPFDALLVGASNLLLIGQDWLMFAGVNHNGHLYYTSNFATSPLPAYRFLFVPQAWSLGTEAVFYLLAPFIVTRRPVIVSAICAASLCIKSYLYTHGFTNDPWSYRFFPAELSFFLFGSLAYRFYAFMKSRDFYRSSYSVVAWLLVVGMIMTVGKIQTPLAMCVFMPFFVIALPFVFMLTKNWKIDRLIGEHSYPFYISQFVASEIAFRLHHTTFIPVLIVTALISVALYWIIDRNVDNFRHRIVDRFERLNKKPTIEPVKETSLIN